MYLIALNYVVHENVLFFSFDLFFWNYKKVLLLSHAGLKLIIHLAHVPWNIFLKESYYHLELL